MSTINFQRTYRLSAAYESVKERAGHVLAKYLGRPDLFLFNDTERTITYSTERLIPTASTNRPRVMLLFSNPHPYSVQQGMFLSRNTRGQENLFWPVMEDAGWLPILKVHRSPEQLREICLRASYQGPFELIFYCYYAFPTDYPEDIQKIFGKVYCNQVIEPEASQEFLATIEAASVEAVVTFNKAIYNLVSQDQIDRYIERLKQGELIHSQVRDLGRHIRTFLTFPTGWHFDKQFRELRRASLVRIEKAIRNRPNQRSARHQPSASGGSDDSLFGRD